jgi:formamidopyrimidine-DNA glycosylase
MPELPEVETLVRRLRPSLVGSTFTNVTVNWRRSVETSLDSLCRGLPGLRVLDVSRRGKYIWVALSEGSSLLVHLRMTGDLRVLPPSTVASPHDRVIFHLDDGTQLRFKDQRNFGRIHFSKEPERVLAHLGPEPLAADFSLGDFVRRLDERQRMIKPLLLDQSFVAGLGNIYADETLFLSGIRPDRRANTLTSTEMQRLYQSIRIVLAAAIDHSGSTLADRTYRGGEYQEHLNVYGRESKPCYKCGTLVMRIVLAQRSSHFCPVCQQ